MKKAIVIGASAGIGRAVAKELARQGFCLGLADCNFEKLASLVRELTSPVCMRKMDVTRRNEAREILRSLIDEMVGADIIIISAGVIFQDPTWEQEHGTIEVNVSGFTAIFNAAFAYFAGHGGGHIVGISSVAAVRGGHGSPVYNASKAFISSLMDGFRIKARRLRLPITITDIRPGHVSTAMLEGQRGAFWVIPTEAAAGHIVRAILKRKKHAYVTPRWRIIAIAMRLLPDWLYARFES